MALAAAIVGGVLRSPIAFTLFEVAGDRAAARSR
jgi:hypothetical protein